MAVLPYKNSGLSKKDQVREMFDNISHRYDLLNHLLSFNIDKVWRNNAIKKLSNFNPEYVLDIATGTGDFAIAIAKLKPRKIIGIDLSEGMLKVGRNKLAKRELVGKIELVKGDSEQLPFPDSYFDAATVGFGVRNFEDLEKGLSEIFRVLKPNGAFIILEFSIPREKLFKHLYNLYFNNILPLLGRLISRDKSAYKYLPESVNSFPDGMNFISVLENIGFEKCHWFPQTFGIASIYEAQKPEN